MITLSRDTETPIAFILHINGTNSLPSEVRVLLGTSPKIMVIATSQNGKNYSAVIPCLSDVALTNNVSFKVEVLINSKLVVPFNTTANVESVAQISFEPEQTFPEQTPEPILTPTVVVAPEFVMPLAAPIQEPIAAEQITKPKQEILKAEIVEEVKVAEQIIDDIEIKESIKGRVKGLLKGVMGESRPIDVKMVMTPPIVREHRVPIKSRVKLIKGEIITK